MSRKNRILNILKQNQTKHLRISFSGAFREFKSGSAPQWKLAKQYMNHGIFHIEGDRLICDGMPFSRHISKVSAILLGDKILFGKYCKNCSRAIPKDWMNCPICCGALETPNKIN